MKDNKNHAQRLERVMNQLADSVLGLSDEAILGEVSEAGADPEEEAERTGRVLRQASQALESVNRRLSNLGHSIDSHYWWRERWTYHNHRLSCGLSVSFKPNTGEMQGKAVDAPCSRTGEHRMAKTASE